MRERSRTFLVLTEIAIMVLVFAISAAVCLRLFASARETAAEAGAVSRAAMYAQSAAEAYKAAGGDVQKAAGSISAHSLANGFAEYYTADWTPAEESAAAYTLTLTDSGGTAQIVVAGADGGAVFSLTVKAVTYG